MRVGESHISVRTFVLIVGGLVVLLALAVGGLAMTHGLSPASSHDGLSLATDLGSLFFDVVACVALLLAAGHYAAGNPLRRIWLMLGVGIGVYAVGDLVWMLLDVGAKFRAVPYPSAADVFYLATYVFLAIGLTRAAQAFGRAARLRATLVAGIVVTALAALLVYAFVALPIVRDPSASLAVKTLGVVYPAADILLLFGPALFIILAARSISGHQVVRQWWTLATGFLLMAASDVAFTWFDWTGRYFAGHPVDFGWMLSLLIIGVAGSLVADGMGAHAERV